MTARAGHRWQAPLLVRLSAVIHAAALLALVAEPRAWRWILAALVINHLFIAATGLCPRSTWLGDNCNRLPQAARARNEIALTIDDGPDPEVTPQVLALLDRYRVKASFFVIADQAERYPDLCRDIVRRGHAVENHTQHHRHNFSLLGLRGYRREIQAAQTTLARITGVSPQFFRAPAGLRNPFLDPVLHRLNLQLASWSVRGYDTRTRDAVKVETRLARGLQAGAIVLLHDGHAARTADNVPVIVAILPGILTAAADAQLNFVTLREACRKAKTPDSSGNCV